MNGSRKLILAAAAITAFATHDLAGFLRTSQNRTRQATTPKWEAVSIKRCRDDSAEGQRGDDPSPPFRFSADRMTLRCLTVRTLVQSAYKTYVPVGGLFSDEDAILLRALVQTTPIEGGPAWMDAEQYMIEAKAEGVADRKIMQGEMLRKILEDRFQLKAHHDMRSTPVYALTVANGAAKLKPFQEGSCTAVPRIEVNGLTGPPPSPPRLPQGQRYCDVGGGVNGNVGATHVVIHAEGSTIDQFIKGFLYGEEGKPVIDRTGLKQKYDIHLEYAMNDAARQRYSQATGIALSELPTSPSIFTALQEQLGLKLESIKAPVEFLVIDRIERPSPN